MPEPTRELSGAIEHCERPVTMRHTRISWVGEHEVQQSHFRCDLCGANGTVTVSTPVGPPVGLTANA